MNNAFDIACKEKYLHFLFTIIEYDYEPILMVLRDDYQNLFLGLCSELRGMRRWIVALTNGQVLRGLLDFKYAINEALKALSNTAYVIERRGSEYRFERVPFSQVNPLYLAEEGVYAEFTDEDCEENLARVMLEYDMPDDDRENNEVYYLDSFSAVLTNNQLNSFFYHAPEKDYHIPDRMKLPSSKAVTRYTALTGTISRALTGFVA